VDLQEVADAARLYLHAPASARIRKGHIMNTEALKKKACEHIDRTGTR